MSYPMLPSVPGQLAQAMPMPSASPAPAEPSAPLASDVGVVAQGKNLLPVKEADQKASIDLENLDVSHYRQSEVDPEFSGAYKWIPLFGWAAYGIKCLINRNNHKKADEHLKDYNKPQTDKIAALDSAITTANDDVRNRYLLMRAREHISQGNVNKAKEDLDKIQPSFQKSTPEYWALKSVTDLTNNKVEARKDLRKVQQIHKKQQEKQKGNVNQAQKFNPTAWSQRQQVKLLKSIETEQKGVCADLTVSELKILISEGEKDANYAAHINALPKKEIESSRRLSPHQKKLALLALKYSGNDIKSQVTLLTESINLLREFWDDIGCGYKLETEALFDSSGLWLPGDKPDHIHLDDSPVTKNTKATLEQAQSAFDRILKLSNQSLDGIQVLADFLIQRSITSLYRGSYLKKYDNYNHTNRHRPRKFKRLAIAGATRNLQQAWNLYEKLIDAEHNYFDKIKLTKEFLKACSDSKSNNNFDAQTTQVINTFTAQAIQKKEKFEKDLSVLIEKCRKEIEKGEKTLADHKEFFDKVKSFDTTLDAFIAKCYAMGTGVQKDLMKAYQILETGQAYNKPLCEAETIKLIEEQYRILLSGNNDAPALEFLIESAKKYPLASEHLGDCFTKGLGVVKDYKRAYNYYESAVIGNRDCENAISFLLHQMYEDLVSPKDGSSHEEQIKLVNIAIEIFEKTQIGRPIVSYWLGEIYSKGMGITPNPIRAKERYMRAAIAERGASIPAQLQLARYFDTGINFGQHSMKSDFPQAQKFYEMVANSTHESACEAQHGLARLMLKRLKAKEQGITYLQVLRLFKKASDTYEKRQANQKQKAEQDVKADKSVANTTTTALSTPNDDLKQLFSLLTPAPTSEVEGAVGGSVDPIAKAKLEEELKQQGIHYSTLLGKCYEEGLGVDQGMKEAAAHYETAAASNDREGQYLFATCLLHGKGVPQNKDLAKDYCQKAIKQGYELTTDEKYLFGIAPLPDVVMTIPNFMNYFEASGEGDNNVKWFTTSFSSKNGNSFWIGVSYDLNEGKKIPKIHVCKDTTPFKADFLIGKTQFTQKNDEKSFKQRIFHEGARTYYDFNLSLPLDFLQSCVQADGSLKVEMIVRPA